MGLIGILAAGIGYVYLSDPPEISASDGSAETQEAAAPGSESPTGTETPTASDGGEAPPAEPPAREENAEAPTVAPHPAGEADTASADPSETAPSSELPETVQSGQTARNNQVPRTAEAVEAGKEQTEPAAEVSGGGASGGGASPAEHEEKPEEHTPAGAAGNEDAVEAGAEDPAQKSDAAPETEPETEPETAPATDTGENPQQAALPKVAAPDHDSLPLWQRNRQIIDRRGLKDASGNPKPRIAFILSELGHARTAAEEIIKKLPPAVTLSFSPYANPRSLEYLSALARSNGHEVMLDLPLEPSDFPQRDPGPKALLIALEPQENLERLRWSLERASGYVGVAVWMGSRFVGSPRQMRPLMETLHDRGLLYLDNAEREDSLGPSLAREFNVPAVTSHRYVDVPLASRDAIDARLAQVERIALQFGSAVAMGRPFPVTVERLAVWSAELEKRGIVLVPITVLAEQAATQYTAGKSESSEDYGEAPSGSASGGSAQH